MLIQQGHQLVRVLLEDVTPVVDVKVVPSELTAVPVCFPCYVGSGWFSNSLQLFGRSWRIRCRQRLTAGSIHPDPGVRVFSFGRVLPPWQGGKPRAVPSQRHAGSVGSFSKSPLGCFWAVLASVLGGLPGVLVGMPSLLAVGAASVLLVVALVISLGTLAPLVWRIASGCVGGLRLWLVLGSRWRFTLQSGLER